MTQTTMTRDAADELQVHRLESEGVTELFVTASSQTTPAEKLIEQAIAVAKEQGATIIMQDVFAPVAGAAPLVVDWPVTWVDSGHEKGSALVGTELHAIIGVDVERVEFDGRPVGSIYETDEAKYCRLAGVIPADVTASRPDQTTSGFERMEAGLKQAGMSFADVARTWLYLANILDWYGPFNLARDEFFKHRRQFDIIVPASTGIGGANPHGAAMLAGAIAIQPKSKTSTLREVISPLQNSALDYGSSFSRAVEFKTDKTQRLWVSGTASIEPGGDTVHLDDAANQIDLTMRVVEAILESIGMGWQDLTRSIAYLKQADYLPLFTDYCREYDIPLTPWLITENDVCRDNLLFEIEIDAIK